MVIVVLFFVFCLVFANEDEEVRRLGVIVSDGVKESQDFVLPVDNSEFFCDFYDTETKVYGYYDFIVVGSGTAGSLVARELAKNKAWKILLLEAGGDFDEFSEIPGMSPYLHKSRMNWGYYTVPQKNSCQGMVNKQCMYPRGKVLGGSGTINGLLYGRGHPEDYLTWPGWYLDEVFDSFRAIEKWDTDGDPGYHGYNGPLNCNKTNPNAVYNEVYTEALRSLGQQEVDYNGECQLGFSKSVYTLDYNKRVSGATAFLEDIPDNLEISKHSLVTKLVVDERKVVYGVEFIKNHRLHVAVISKEVILSAGSINTPQILMLSGIGPKKELRKHGIKLVKELPVGENLVEHPLFLGFNVRTNMSHPLGDLKENLRKYLNAGTPLTSALPSDIISFVKLTEDFSQKPDIEYLMSSASGYDNITKFMFNTNNQVTQYMQASKLDTDMQIFMLLLHEKSRGSVKLKSRSIKDFPLIDFNLFEEEEDLEILYRGIEYMLDVLETQPMQQINATILAPTTFCKDEEFLSRSYWYCVIRHLTMGCYHPTGTTRMGESELNSVVNTNGKVHDIHRLRVVDAGIIPDTISGHTNGPTFMLAYKIAQEIILEHNKQNSY